MLSAPGNLRVGVKTRFTTEAAEVTENATYFPLVIPAKAGIQGERRGLRPGFPLSRE